MKSVVLERPGHPALTLVAEFPLQVEGPEAGDYARKRQALVEYRDGASLKSIQLATGICRQHLYYLRDRILRTADDGLPFGHRALLKNFQCERHYPEELLSRGKAVPGVLRALFKKFPKLKKVMFEFGVLGKLPDGSRIPVNRVTTPALKALFHEQCQELKLGLQPGQFPFVQGGGARALRGWVKAARRANEQAKRRLADSKKANDPWYLPSSRPAYVFERVECDAKHMDVDWLLELPSLRGEGVQRVKVSRVWLIALVEVRSSAILGYALAWGTNYSSSDVLRAVRSALVPWEPRNLCTEGFAYAAGEGLPNASDEVLSFVCWDEFWLDGWRANWSDMTLTTIEQMVGCVTVVGPAGEPNARPHIESTFNLLTMVCELVRKYCHKQDGDQSETQKSHAPVVPWRVLLDFLDVLIARFNGSRAPGTSQSRNEVLVNAVQRQADVIRRVPVELREWLRKYDCVDRARIADDRGHIHIWWSNARYAGLGLHSRDDLVGQWVTLAANSDKPGVIEVTLVKDGTCLGELTIERALSADHLVNSRKNAKAETAEHGFVATSGDLQLAVARASVRLSNAEQPTIHRVVEAAIKQGLLDAAQGAEAAAAPRASMPSPAEAPPQRSPPPIPKSVFNVVQFARPAGPQVDPDDAADEDCGATY